VSKGNGTEYVYQFVESGISYVHIDLCLWDIVSVYKFVSVGILLEHVKFATKRNSCVYAN